MKDDVNYHLWNGMDIVNLKETEMENDLGAEVSTSLSQ